MGVGDAPRSSLPGKPAALAILTPEERALKEAENGLKQFDRMVELVERAIAPGAPGFRLRPSTLLDLQRIAVDGLVASAGFFRQGTITISGTQHQPPAAAEVAEHVDEMCEYVHDHWEAPPVHLSAYVMWRLNWIHPFDDGNGRTSRAVSYLVLCARLRQRLPGTKTIPERIAEAKFPYYDALDSADAAWCKGEVDVHKMQALLEVHLRDQLIETFNAATGR